MSGTVELLPCRCGKVPEVVRRDVEPQGDPWYGEKIELFVLCDCGLCLFDGHFHEGFADDAAAIAAWNTRASPPSPADKATDDVRGLVKRLRRGAELIGGENILAATDLVAAATALQSLAIRIEELSSGQTFVSVDHTGCIYTTADEDRAIAVAKQTLDEAVQSERSAREAAERDRDEALKALEPFARAARNIPKAKDDDTITRVVMPEILTAEEMEKFAARGALVSSPHSQLIVSFDGLRARDFRRARELIGEKGNG